MKPALLLLPLLLLAGCGREPDIFGRSFDECVLRNAKGGDTESRQSATDICARHFTRVPKLDEAHQFEVETSLKGRDASAGSDELAQAFDVPSVEFQVRNTSEVVLKRLKISVIFHISGKPDQTLWWIFDTNIEPNGMETLTGGFGKSGPPSQRFDTTSELLKVMPHS